MGALVLKSEQQILGSQIAKFLAETALNDINAGSVNLTLMEANAQELFQQYVQLLNIIRNYNLDTTTGADLDKRGFEFGLTRRGDRKATGKIRILRPTGFVKVSTSFYSGLPAPVLGDTKVRVNDASDALFSTSGTLILGRGTDNEEEVTYSAAPTDFVNYWEFTVSACAKSHGLDESVILKQGTDQTIIAGTVIVVPASGLSPEIQFTVDHDTFLLSGEDKVDNVDITASKAGSDGNIPIRVITGTEAFATPPFVGARAENTSKFSTGANRETDDEFRDRIKRHIQTLSNATKLAIYNAIIGLVDADTAKRVVSANVILPSIATDPVEIYLDDGTGFEPSFDSVGLEEIITQSTGGETRLQLAQFPLVKAQIETNVEEPFNMSSGTLPLQYTVGLVSETINFLTSDFDFPEAATAEEIVAVINNKATLIEARTSESGKKVVIQAISETNEDIQITGGSSNNILNFPTDQRSTLYLYVDDTLLSKDGSTAYVDTNNQQTYNFSGLGAAPWPLTVIVDGKSANVQTVNFQAADFVNPLAATAAEVKTAINAALAGATASVLSNVKVRLQSNTLLSSSSKIQVTGGSANTVLGFSTSQQTGSNRDYTLNRQTGSIELISPLAAQKSASSGSLFTRAKLRTAAAENYSITAAQTLVVVVDGGADQTVTFPTTGLFTAAQVAAAINLQLIGATAIVRTIGGLNYLEINTNTYKQATGSIRVKNTSTATALNFTYNTTVTNQRPHRAFVTTSGGGPYAFPLSQGLVVVMDNSPATKTFTVMFDYGATLTSATSTTVMADSSLNTVFPANSDLTSFYAIAKTGANTTTGTVTTVTAQGGGTFRYAFSVLPTNLASYNTGDHFNVTGLQNSENNGNFIITARSTAGTGYVEVTNADGIAENASSGTSKVAARRQISAHTGATGSWTLSSPLPFAPSIGDTFGLAPSTLANVVAYMNNKKITTLSTKALIAVSDVFAKAQISSLEDGSDGYVQVTGGSANDLLGFSTSPVRGLQGYNHYTGLLKLCHRTIYGDDSDLVTYPGVGAAGIEFRLLAPTVQDLEFAVTLTLQTGISITNVENDVKSAITGYVNSLGVGDDVVLSEIIQRIMDIDGISDVEINVPTANITIADNELARTNDAAITVG